MTGPLPENFQPDLAGKIPLDPSTPAGKLRAYQSNLARKFSTGILKELWCGNDSKKHSASPLNTG
jgi:hypothetical protein